ncbi:hypothetical protein PROFUN_07387 [Planoprotostelium fungivorum]|uniref:SAP domain-containing protein n=1 Tax=Planoprotostelium fungivorum TaxID=1890364 RepID=A0A2P6MTI9_9EUKA|nr:hypothetical protein PROFUN_07387 [Planoprotostelium fungivorum]
MQVNLITKNPLLRSNFQSCRSQVCPIDEAASRSDCNLQFVVRKTDASESIFTRGICWMPKRILPPPNAIFSENLSAEKRSRITDGLTEDEDTKLSHIHQSMKELLKFRNVREELPMTRNTFKLVLSMYIAWPDMPNLKDFVAWTSEYGFRPDNITYVALLQWASRKKQRDTMDHWVNTMMEDEKKMDDFTYRSIAEIYAQNRMIPELKILLRKMSLYGRRIDVDLFNEIIKKTLPHGQDAVAAVMEDMREFEIPPNSVTISMIGQLAEKEGDDQVLQGALQYMAGGKKKLSHEDRERLFEFMSKKNGLEYALNRLREGNTSTHELEILFGRMLVRRLTEQRYDEIERIITEMKDVNHPYGIHSVPAIISYYTTRDDTQEMKNWCNYARRHEDLQVSIPVESVSRMLSQLIVDNREEDALSWIDFCEKNHGPLQVTAMNHVIRFLCKMERSDSAKKWMFKMTKSGMEAEARTLESLIEASILTEDRDVRLWESMLLKLRRTQEENYIRLKMRNNKKLCFRSTVETTASSQNTEGKLGLQALADFSLKMNGETSNHPEGEVREQYAGDGQTGTDGGNHEDTQAQTHTNQEVYSENSQGHPQHESNLEEPQQMQDLQNVSHHYQEDSSHEHHLEAAHQLVEATQLEDQHQQHHGVDSHSGHPDEMQHHYPGYSQEVSGHVYTDGSQLHQGQHLELMQSQDESDDKDEILDEKELAKLPVAMLKEKCRVRGMKIGGSKLELIARLTGTNPTLDFGRERKRKVEVLDNSPAKRSTKSEEGRLLAAGFNQRDIELTRSTSLAKQFKKDAREFLQEVNGDWGVQTETYEDQGDHCNAWLKNVDQYGQSVYNLAYHALDAPSRIEALQRAHDTLFTIADGWAQFEAVPVRGGANEFRDRALFHIQLFGDEGPREMSWTLWLDYLWKSIICSAAATGLDRTLVDRFIRDSVDYGVMHFRQPNDPHMEDLTRTEMWRRGHEIYEAIYREGKWTELPPHKRQHTTKKIKGKSVLSFDFSYDRSRRSPPSLRMTVKEPVMTLNCKVCGLDSSKIRVTLVKLQERAKGHRTEAKLQQEKGNTIDRRWHLEDASQSTAFIGTPEMGQTSHYALFMMDDKGFQVFPVDEWYTFDKRPHHVQSNKTSAEEAESALYNREHKLNQRLSKMIKVEVKKEEDREDPEDNVEEFSILGRMDRSKKKAMKSQIKTEENEDIDNADEDEHFDREEKEEAPDLGEDQIEEEPEEDKTAADEEPTELNDYGKEVVRLQKEHKDEMEEDIGSEEEEEEESDAEDEEDEDLNAARALRRPVKRAKTSQPQEDVTQRSIAPSAAPTGDITEEEIRRALLGAGKIRTQQLLNKFKKRLVDQETRGRFAKMLKKLSQTVDEPGGKFIMLKDEYRGGLKVN